MGKLEKIVLNYSYFSKIDFYYSLGFMLYQNNFVKNEEGQYEMS